MLCIQPLEFANDNIIGRDCTCLQRTDYRSPNSFSISERGMDVNNKKESKKAFVDPGTKILYSAADSLNIPGDSVVGLDCHSEIMSMISKCRDFPRCSSNSEVRKFESYLWLR